jgi:thioredoxin
MRRRLPWILAAVALAAVVAIGLSQAPESSAPSAGRPQRLTAAQINARLKGSPPALAALHRQSNQVLDGGREAFRRRLAALKGHPVVVNFWAAWCGPCRAMAPQFEQAARRLKGEAILAKVDSDASPLASSRFGIRSIPTLVLFRNGKEIARQAGAVQAAQIVSWVQAADQPA